MVRKKTPKENFAISQFKLSFIVSVKWPFEIFYQNVHSILRTVHWLESYWNGNSRVCVCNSSFLNVLQCTTIRY